MPNQPKPTINNTAVKPKQLGRKSANKKAISILDRAKERKKKRAKNKEKFERAKEKYENPGPFSRWLKLHTWMPAHFRMLTKLFNMPGEHIIHDFMVNAGMEYHGNTIGGGCNERARNLLKEYWLACGYGDIYYNVEERRQMLKELESIASLFPRDVDGTTGHFKIIDRHSKWRKHYHKFWYKKWYYSIRRKKLKNES